MVCPGSSCCIAGSDKATSAVNVSNKAMNNGQRTASNNERRLADMYEYVLLYPALFLGYALAKSMLFYFQILGNFD